MSSMMDAEEGVGQHVVSDRMHVALACAGERASYVPRSFLMAHVSSSAKTWEDLLENDRTVILADGRAWLSAMTAGRVLARVPRTGTVYRPHRYGAAQERA